MDVRNVADSKNDLDSQLKTFLPLIFNKHDQQWWSGEVARIARNDRSIDDFEIQINQFLSRLDTVPDHLFLEGKDFIETELANFLDILRAYRKYRLTDTFENLARLCVLCYQADYPVPINKTIDLSRLMHTEMTRDDCDHIVIIMEVMQPTLLIADCHIDKEHAAMLRDIFARSLLNNYRIYFGNVRVDPATLCDLIDTYCKRGFSNNHSNAVTIKLDRHGITCICLPGDKQVLKLNLEEVDFETRKQALTDFSRLMPRFALIDLADIQLDDALLLQCVLPILETLEMSVSTPDITLASQRLTLNGITAFANQLRIPHDNGYESFITTFFVELIFRTVGQRLTPPLDSYQLFAAISKTDQTILSAKDRDLLLFMKTNATGRLHELAETLQEFCERHSSAANADAKAFGAVPITANLKPILDALTTLLRPQPVLHDAKEAAPVVKIMPAEAMLSADERADFIADLHLYLSAIFRRRDKKLWQKIIDDIVNPENLEENYIEDTEVRIKILAQLLHFVPDTLFLRGKPFFLQELSIFIDYLYQWKAHLRQPTSESLYKLSVAGYQFAYPVMPFNDHDLSFLSPDEIDAQDMASLVDLINQFGQPILFKHVVITEEHWPMLQNIFSQCPNVGMFFLGVRIQPVLLQKIINAYCKSEINPSVFIHPEDEKIEVAFKNSGSRVLQLELETMHPEKRRELLAAVLKTAPKFSKVILKNCRLDDELLLDVILPLLEKTEFTLRNFEVFDLSGNNFTLDCIMQFANHLKTGNTFHHERLIMALIIEKIFAAMGESFNPPMDANQLHEEVFKPNQTILYPAGCVFLRSLSQITSLHELEQVLQRFCNSHQANADVKGAGTLPTPAEIDELKWISYALTKLFNPQAQPQDAKLLAVLNAQKKEALKKQLLAEHREKLLNDVVTHLKDFMANDEFTFRKLQDYLLNLFKKSDIGSISIALANLITLNKHWTHLDLLLQFQFSWHFGLRKVNFVTYDAKPDVMIARLNCFRRSHTNNVNAEHDEKNSPPLTTTLFLPKPSISDFLDKYEEALGLLGLHSTPYVQDWREQLSHDEPIANLEVNFYNDLISRIIPAWRQVIEDEIEKAITTATNVIPEVFMEVINLAEYWDYYYQTKDMPERLPNRRAAPDPEAASPRMTR